MIAAVGCGPRAPGFRLASMTPSISLWVDFFFVGRMTVAVVTRRLGGCQCAKGPPTERRRVAPGPLLVGVARNTVKIQVAKGPHTECRRVAPGPLLVGVARKHVKISGFWAAEHFLFAPNRMQIGADLRHRVFEGVAKMRRRGL